MHAETGFRESAAQALGDPQIRANFRRAMDGLMAKRAAQFPDPADLQALRSLGTAIRARSLLKLPELLEQLEASCLRNGIQVHWARTCEEGNELILGLLRARGATRLVKGKSMVSEEMGLNHFLEEHGVEALESDLGEYIIQLDQETPSHIIMPAIHKNKTQIARQFSQKIKDAKYTEDVDELTALARKVLRRKFLEADAGLSGVNFAVADTGTLCLVENEGNGRMSTHVPALHIAVMGLEKVVETLEDVAPLYALLTRSATGQAVSTYLNLVRGPRGPGELDGPREVHLVILDNGRSRIYADPQLRATLRCIRCGACMNHCPVYTRVGGHAYQAVYPGPIGKILTPQMEGVGVRHELLHGSSLCGACSEVCPVEIPIPEIIVRLRREATHRDPGSSVEGRGTGRTATEDLAWRVWAAVLSRPGAYRFAAWCATRFRNLIPGGLPLLKAWTLARGKPVPARRSLQERVREEGIPHG
ncbi:LutB/LldF family L-lactate oxidation iron-sulfur protein [Mesoterricola silvestris]|uniref:4Fe-4S ferredoxin n=1 Tax=Mesoterricola silvestris TaxID=2927979 RepID=A0AA48K6Z3_9BACT|nr:LutB/LldF family L-lactate oxidation iron-sulfur protein [Mesoterricola silvestris]BDU71314.1 4Fe-4S ferredoxin [Mesoterricola silvestris]